ncbi:DM13 domain-containing protein [Fischerella sp. PCC 9605]|uniref:DM13 domain-containing protein n=1 Tax=Fischerella sp. PCC 9605 TaxID=1173024 RepID=UPI00047A1408|nr:DM13 domain-containing protein [Fischerella sp. PCC 9605]
MKFKFLAVISIVTLLTIACARDVNSKQPVSETQPATPVAQSSTANVSQTGSFVRAEQPTQGNVKVLTENGKRYLEFDGSFKTNQGPDLFVILYRNGTVPVSGIKEKDYVSIARLQKTSGTQRYAVPDNVKLTDYQSVAIWCRKFNATFGYASLGN